MKVNEMDADGRPRGGLVSKFRNKWGVEINAWISKNEYRMDTAMNARWNDGWIN